MKTPTVDGSHKAILDSLLLQIPGVEAGEMSGLPAYFVSKKMFACIYGTGVGIRLPVATATELQFSRENIVPFRPNGSASTREWVQVNHDDPADYKNDLEIFQAAVAFVKADRRR